LPILTTPEGTYGSKMPGGTFLARLLEPLAKRQIASYRKSGGNSRMIRMMKMPVVLLTTKGARSGQERTVTINGFADGDDRWLVVASKGGAATHPAWFRNMVQHPDDIQLEVGSRRMKVRGDTLTGPERAEALARIVTELKQYAGYETKTDRQIPIVRLTRISD
jgi:deazaflavin-dependent oxidoreductase (nitroreductase family)